jgi:hypothetical protein
LDLTTGVPPLWLKQSECKAVLSLVYTTKFNKVWSYTSIFLSFNPKVLHYAERQLSAP